MTPRELKSLMARTHSSSVMLGEVLGIAPVHAAITFSFSAFAAGVDSRAYSCDGLRALVAANRFVFINYPSFMDFIVANSSYCSAGEILTLRSVPTSDNPECLVNYCKKRPSTTN
jgi:hypothetical protein